MSLISPDHGRIHTGMHLTLFLANVSDHLWLFPPTVVAGRHGLDRERCALPPNLQRGADARLLSPLIRTRDGRILPFGYRIITLLCERRGFALRQGGTEPLTIILVCLLPCSATPHPHPLLQLKVRSYRYEIIRCSYVCGSQM